MGENKKTTAINGMNSIGADYVVVTNLMFLLWGPAITIKNFSNVVIENCVFNRPTAGILIETSTNDTIRNCTFHNDTNTPAFLIVIRDSTNIEISYCDFSGSSCMLSPIELDSSKRITIHHCSFVRNGGFSVHVLFCRGISIHHCNFTDNYGGGVQAMGSVVQLTYNNFMNNGHPGVEFTFLQSGNLRNNWWGSPQGPSINFTTLHSLRTIYGSIRMRTITNGDTVNFYGLTSIRPFVKIISLIPWRSEPVPDAGWRP